MIIASRQVEAAFEILCLMSSTDITPVSELVIKTGRCCSAVEQIMSPLRRAGLVDSHRGPGGGYRMTRSLVQITVSDLITALNPEPAVRHAPGLLTALMPQIQGTPLSALAERLSTVIPPCAGGAA